MAHITDPRMLIALEIHKGAIKLIQKGHTYHTAIKFSRDAMQELFPEENVTEFRVPHWTSTNT